MLDHVSLQVDDLEASAEFYDAVLEPLGSRRIMAVDGAIGYGPDFPSFWIGTATTGDGFRETHIAFTAPDRGTVLAFREAAVAMGAEVLHEPRVFPEYHPTYFGVFVRDPDGNHVEAVCHTPE
jgi:catechol 2,3-dioxygenase-like lactoylglutathione lyase family enzyme